MEIDLLVKVYIPDEWCDEANCARVVLTERLVRQIFILHRKAGKKDTAKTYECSPELGNSEVDLEKCYYRNMSDFSSMMGNSVVFVKNSRVDYIELNVDSSHFWWSGRFKFSDTYWETGPIPLDFIPEEMKPKVRPKKYTQLSDQQLQEIMAIARSGAVSTDRGSEVKKFTKDQLYQAIKKILKE